MYDLIIIGAGPAGITAAVYAARRKLNFLIIGELLGGQMTFSWEIENYTGYSHLSGEELTKRFKEHMDKYDVEFKEGDKVTKVEKIGDNYKVYTSADESFESRSLIIATGASPRKLDIPGEDEFRGKGLTYCATCDGPLFKDKVVVVIGGGDAALESTDQMTKIASKVYLLARGKEMGGHEENVKKRVLSDPKVELITGAFTKEIYGEGMVKGLRYAKGSDEGEIIDLPVEGIFVEIGRIPASDTFKGLVDMNERGEIIAGKHMETSQPGVFAAGDCTDNHDRQIVISAGDGCKALLGAAEYILKHY